MIKAGVLIPGGVLEVEDDFRHDLLTNIVEPCFLTVSTSPERDFRHQTNWAKHTILESVLGPNGCDVTAVA